MGSLAQAAGRWRAPIEAAGAFTAIFVLSVVAVELRPTGAATAAWWPASGLAVAWMLRAGVDRRRVLLTCVAMASLAANLAAGRGLGLAVAFAVANSTEAVVVTWWLTRGRPGAPALAQVADVGRFLAATMLVAVSAGAIAGVAVHVAVGAEFGSNARTVALAHAAGIVLIAPWPWCAEGRDAPVSLVHSWPRLSASGHWSSP